MTLNYGAIMSYLVLARKSRPQTFDQVIGQQTVVKTLQNSLKRNRIAHAILFSGVRGVGKTTLARIMAKAINCESETENRPCDQCDSCKSIAKGSSIDLYEIDGASNRGIQEIRELKEKIKYLPSSSKYRIIIIDEVHMLTTEAFNALLKTLEEPPEHVYFMFATTELHKIPITILSRCQRYELKRVSTDELFSHFRRLAASEGISIDDDALLQVVREADGSVRDGLSLLDQIFSYGENHITLNDAVEVLGLVNRDLVLTIAEALLTGRKADALNALSEIFKVGTDIKRFTSDLLECFRVLQLCKIQGCENLINLAELERKSFMDLAARHSAETIHAKLNLLLKGLEEIRYSSQPRLSLETTFLKIIEAGNITSIPTLIDKIDQLLEQNSGIDFNPSLGNIIGAASSSEEKKKPELKSDNEDRLKEIEANIGDKPYITSTAAAPIAINEEKKQTVPAAAHISVEEPPLPEEPPPAEHFISSRQSETSIPESPTVQDRQPASNSDQDTETSKIKPVRAHWMEFIKYVKERKLWMSQVLQRADRIKEHDNELRLEYDDHFNCAQLKEKENYNALTEFVLDFFQKELKVRIISPDLTSDDIADGEESPHKKRQKLAADPLVIRTLETFSGQIGEIRVGPRSR